MKLPSNKTT